MSKHKFKLLSTPKKYNLDQDKAVDPKLTIKRALKRISRLKDLKYFRLKPVETVIEGTHSYTCQSNRLNTFGKGITAEQAQASALMEFCERYSFLSFNYSRYDGYTIKTFREMLNEGTATVDQSYFLSNFPAIGNKGQLLEEIKGIPLKWIKGVSLISGRDFYYPLNWHNYIFTSNGLASGNTLEEAILSALCEVIERENIYKFFVEKKIGNDVDLKSFDDPLIINLLKNAKRAGIKLKIKDISLDLKIPTFILRGTCPRNRKMLTYKGSGQGCYPNPGKALIRCLTEYFEFFAAIHRIEKKQMWFDWDEFVSFMPKRNYGFINLFNISMFNKKAAVSSRSTIKDLGDQDIAKEINGLIAVLKSRKYDVIVIDKTHPGLRIPVVRVFVPGMRSNIFHETRDVRRIMSLAYHEAQMYPEAVKNLKMSLFGKNYSFHLGEIGEKIDFYDDDYLKTMSNLGTKNNNSIFLRGGVVLGS